MTDFDKKLFTEVDLELGLKICFMIKSTENSRLEKFKMEKGENKRWELFANIDSRDGCARRVHAWKFARVRARAMHSWERQPLTARRDVDGNSHASSLSLLDFTLQLSLSVVMYAYRYRYKHARRQKRKEYRANIWTTVKAVFNILRCTMRALCASMSIRRSTNSQHINISKVYNDSNCQSTKIVSLSRWN